jgi:hypothetical protein
MLYRFILDHINRDTQIQTPKRIYIYIYIYMCQSFSPVPPHVHVDFVVPHPGCGRSVTDFWCWSAHRAQLRCPDDVNNDMCERGVPGGALNLSSTSYPDHGRFGDLPLQGKIPTAELWIEPGTSWLVVRSSDHQATRLVYMSEIRLRVCTS